VSVPQAARLPHGPEFLFVDEVVETRRGRSAAARLDLATWRRRLAYSGALPPSYLLESMIQTCGLVLASRRPPAAGAWVAGLDKVRWRRPARDGDRILTRCRLLVHSGPFWRFRCLARGSDGALLARGIVTLRETAAGAAGL
jgi:3-hydroxymyristoyl/3-hydroxydecanoyl-(acyl carrier protein) dehydratase